MDRIERDWYQLAHAMSLPLPTIKSGGKERLDALLSEVSAKHNVPAVFYLATNADGTIYENQQGDVNYGDESSGKVNGDTSEYR